MILREDLCEFIYVSLFGLDISKLDVVFRSVMRGILFHFNFGGFPSSQISVARFCSLIYLSQYGHHFFLPSSSEHVFLLPLSTPSLSLLYLSYSLTFNFSFPCLSLLPFPFSYPYPLFSLSLFLILFLLLSLVLSLSLFLSLCFPF